MNIFSTFARIIKVNKHKTTINNDLLTTLANVLMYYYYMYSYYLYTENADHSTLLTLLRDYDCN